MGPHTNFMDLRASGRAPAPFDLGKMPSGGMLFDFNVQYTLI
jgi:hypothetical protein